jgi:hypothetical protein
MAPSTSTPRQTFRETLALHAAQAKAILPPEVNGRIESAVRLVLQADVVFNSDGSATVGSSSDPMKTHTLAGGACDCQDFAYNKAPSGWCAHRIAANLQRSVERVLARSIPVLTAPEVELPEEMEPWADNDIEEVEPPPTPAPAPCPEACFSLTLKGHIDGHEALLTARGQTADEFQRNLAAIKGLLDAKPQAPQVPAVQAPACVEHARGAGWCAVHNTEMRWNDGKDGRQGWYSHKTDQGWCKGRRSHPLPPGR